jgi:uncharacterized protein
MSDPIRKGYGAVLGTGKQFVPWVHEKDICGILFKAVSDEKMSGIYNAVSPNAATNAMLTKDIAEILSKRLWLPHVPRFVLKIMFGEMAEMILEGSRVDATKIKAAGYSFSFPELEPALTNLLKKK